MKEKLNILKILHFFDNKYYPLSSVFFDEQVKALQGNEITLSVVSVNLISLKYIFQKRKCSFGYRRTNMEGVTAHIVDFPSVPYAKTWNNLVRNVLLKWLIKKQIKKNGKPHLSHVQVFFSGGAAIWLKRKMGIPYVVTEHSSGFARNLLSKKELKFARKVFSNSDACMAVSPEFCNLLENLFGVHFDYIPNVFNVSNFSLSKDTKDRKIRNLIAVGSLDENKNHRMLIEAFDTLNDPELTLTIIGEGALHKELSELAAKLQCSERIHFAGNIEYSQLPEFLSESDLLVHSSKYETFGVVIIEAFASGLPVVSTKCGGPEIIIASEKLGILCDHSPEALSTAIHEAILKTWDRKYIREHAEEHYSYSAFRQKMLNVYHKVLSKHSINQ